MVLLSAVPNTPSQKMELSYEMILNQAYNYVVIGHESLW